MRWCEPVNRLLDGDLITSYSTTAIDPDYPWANLTDGLPTEIVRWTTGAQTRLVWQVSAGSPSPMVEGLLIVMYTFAPGAVLKVQANDADAWGAPTFSKDVTVPARDSDGLPPNLCVDLSTTAMATVGFQYISLLIPDAGSPGAHAIGELCWIMQWTTPSVSCAWPVRRADVRRITVNSTSYGVEHIIDRGVRQRRLWPRFSALSDADRALLLRLVRAAGASEPFVLVIDTHETTDFHASAEALYVRFHPETAASFGEELLFYARTDAQLDLLEVQRGIAF